MSDGSARTKGWLVIGFMAMVHALVWAGLFFCFFSMMLAYERNFRDFSLKLSSTAELVVWLYRTVLHYRLLVLPLFLLMVLLDVGILYFLREWADQRGLSWIWFALGLLLPIIASCMGLLSLQGEQLKLLEGLSK